MVESLFKRANKKQAKLRLALIGISGSGKTYSALQIAKYMGEPIAVIDTERGSASKYANLFQFDVVALDSFAPARYIEAIKVAADAGYQVLIIDSLSHAWMGKDSVLEFVDKRAKQNQSNNSFLAWRDASPLHNELVDAMLSCKCHLIVTMRAKTEYIMEEYTDKQGRKKVVPKKIGMQAIQRDSIEYEFDICAELDIENNMIVTKSRCQALTGAVIKQPGKEVATILSQWLQSGTSIDNGSTEPSSDISTSNRPRLVNQQYQSSPSPTPSAINNGNTEQLISQIRSILPEAHTNERKLSEQIKRRFEKESWQELEIPDLAAILKGLSNEVEECRQIKEMIAAAWKEESAIIGEPVNSSNLSGLSKKELKSLLSEWESRLSSVRNQRAL